MYLMYFFSIKANILQNIYFLNVIATDKMNLKMKSIVISLRFICNLFKNSIHILLCPTKEYFVT